MDPIIMFVRLDEVVEDKAEKNEGKKYHFGLAFSPHLPTTTTRPQIYPFWGIVNTLPVWKLRVNFEKKNDMAIKKVPFCPNCSSRKEDRFFVLFYVWMGDICESILATKRANTWWRVFHHPNSTYLHGRLASFALLSCWSASSKRSTRWSGQTANKIQNLAIILALSRSRHRNCNTSKEINTKCRIIDNWCFPWFAMCPDRIAGMIVHFPESDSIPGGYWKSSRCEDIL